MLFYLFMLTRLFAYSGKAFSCNLSHRSVQRNEQAGQRIAKVAYFAGETRRITVISYPLYINYHYVAQLLIKGTIFLINHVIT